METAKHARFFVNCTDRVEKSRLSSPNAWGAP
jgi:hypothetical protein